MLGLLILSVKHGISAGIVVKDRWKNGAIRDHLGRGASSDNPSLFPDWQYGQSEL